MKLNRWILMGAPAAIAGLMLVGASFTVGGSTAALAGLVPACDSTATSTFTSTSTATFTATPTATDTPVIITLAESAGNNLSAFQAPPDTATPTCTPTPRIRTHTPTPEPTEPNTATPVPSNTPRPPTNTPIGGGAGEIRPPDTGTGGSGSGSNMALVWLAGGVALALLGGGAFIVGVRRRA